MNIFYNLSNDLQTYIYEFDSTYHRKYENVVQDVYNLNHHRFFYHNYKGEIIIEPMHPKNINSIFEQKLSNVDPIYLNSLKTVLIEQYNTCRYNIIVDKTDDIYLNVIHQYRNDNDINIQIPQFWFNSNLELF